MLTRMLLSTVALLTTFTGCVLLQDTGDVPNPHAVTFLQVKTAPDSFKDYAVVFGGEVLAARRLKDGTRIEILQLPLDRANRPEYDLTQSQGRFIAMHREFLDPATIPPGTRITVTGKVSGSIILPLDETDYLYPVIEAAQTHIWGRAEDMAPRIRPYLGPSPYWGPYWNPYWRPWPHR